MVMNGYVSYIYDIQNRFDSYTVWGVSECKVGFNEDVVDGTNISYTDNIKCNFLSISPNKKQKILRTCIVCSSQVSFSFFCIEKPFV